MSEAVRTPTVRKVSRPEGQIAVAEYAGEEPTVIAMHGFPDRRSMYHPMAQHLGARRLLAFDFLGWGESDKPGGHRYDSESLEVDLHTVVSELTSGPVCLVAHDASGPTAINWAARNEALVERLVLLNCYYHEVPGMRFPEYVRFYADPELRKLSTTWGARPEVYSQVFTWQAEAFYAVRSAKGDRFGHEAAGKWEPAEEQVGWLMQFLGEPSSIPAYLDLTGELARSLAANSAMAATLHGFRKPVHVAFGETDPYLTPEVASAIAGLFANSTCEFLDANHWPQLELPREVAEIVLEPGRAPRGEEVRSA